VILSRDRLRTAIEEVITTLFTDGDFAANLRSPRVP
jgi:hypothetical protein